MVATVLTMCHRLSSRRILPVSLIIGITTMACDGSETATPQAESAQGGTTPTAQTTGASSAGGASSTPSVGGATTTEAGTSGTTAGPQCASQARRDVNVRLVYPQGLAAPTPSEFKHGDATTRQIDGTLQAFSEVTEACPTCTNGQHQVLSFSIVDGDGKTWTLLADPIELVAGWQEAIMPLQLQPISLMFRYTKGFQSVLSTGFVLSDTAGPVIAAEQAQFVTALKPADLAGFTVAPGEPICTLPGGCAKDVFTQLVFSGDSQVTVDLTQDGEFTIGSQRYMARNSGAGYLIVGTCSDLERASPWSIWRKISP